MKVFGITLALAILSQRATNAFVSQSPMAVKASSALAAVELVPEPEGGEELVSVKTMAGSRMKNMGEVEGVKEDDGTVYKFWVRYAIRCMDQVLSVVPYSYTPTLLTNGFESPIQ